MADTRIHLPLALASGAHIALPEAAFRHLIQVLRMQAGETLTVFNGQGGEYAATLEAVGKREASLRLGAHHPGDRESPLCTTLAQGVSKGDRMDYSLQKATELGVSRIVPLMTERCNLRMDGERWDKKLEHWRGVIVSACEQSGRTRVPELLPVTAYDAWLQRPGASGVRLVLAPEAPHSLAQLPAITAVELLVGPEGGLSDQELARARSAGYTPTRLGPRILRTETAGPAALAILQATLGDLCTDLGSG